MNAAFKFEDTAGGPDPAASAKAPDEAEEGAASGAKARAQRDELIKIAKDAQLWHTPQREPWASWRGQNWPVHSHEFEYRLRGWYYQARRAAVSEGAVKDAAAFLAARAMFDGPEQTVHLRVAMTEYALWIDLADDAGRAVRVTSQGWGVVAGKDVPVKFARPSRMKPLPEPAPPKSLATNPLRCFMSSLNDEDYRLLVSWLTAALRGVGPYPVVDISGPKGAGKTLHTRILRELVDPSTVPLRSLPTNERDLAALARNNHLVVFDNVSGIRAAMSDALCRLATGGGLGGRELYTDHDEATFEAQCPIIINGISNPISRPDLADRTLRFELPILVESRTEASLWQEFGEARLAIFGWLLTVMSEGLKRLPEMDQQHREGRFTLPRMADFALWSMAIAPALGWSPEEFLKAYEANHTRGQADVLENDPVAEGVIALVEAHKGEWTGTAEQLRVTLLKRFGPHADIPGRAQWLSSRLDQLAPALERVAGIRVERPKRTATARPIRLVQVTQG